MTAILTMKRDGVCGTMWTKHGICSMEKQVVQKLVQWEIMAGLQEVNLPT